MDVRPENAIRDLQQLKDEAWTTAVKKGGEALASWQTRVRTVMERSLGPGHHLTGALEDVRYTPSSASASTPDYYSDRARHAGIRQTCGLIDAAIYDVRLSLPAEEPADQRTFDPELWEYVKRTAEAEDWPKVPAMVATFVENHVRTWAGDPVDSRGEPLVGKGLFSKVLADDSEFRLGKSGSEIEGWRMLGVGFVQAIRNVDIHRIQSRNDAHRYAVGVLGLGSLLLTQFRHEHPDPFQIVGPEAYE
jgi:uncharacterized protein Ymh